MKKRILPVLAMGLFILVVICIVLLSSLIKKYTPTSQRQDGKEYFSLSAENDVGVVMQDQKSEVTGKWMNQRVYLEYSEVKNYLNPRFYWDANENVLLYALPGELITVQVGSREYYVAKEKRSADYEIVRLDAQKVYIALDFIQQYTNLEYRFFEAPNRVVIQYQWGDYRSADVKKDTQVRVLGGIKSPILKDLYKDEKILLLEEGEDWVKVRTEDGFIGYVQSKYLANARTETARRDFQEPVYPSIRKNYTINMAWHQVFNGDANSELGDVIADAKGLTTIAPTWFTLSDNNGNISSLADMDYVSYAHQRGIEVWAVVGNIEQEVDTHAILTYTSKRERLINQLIGAAIQYNLDGINVDFEELSVDTGEAFIEFIRELSIKCRNNGIVLSIDNYVPASYNLFYNRAEQGIVADYVVIMGYDEHNGASQEAGSVASLGFVQKGVEDTLQEVPAEKVILGIPFYTRLWQETPAGSSSTLSATAVGMDGAARLLQDHGATPVWDEQTAQYYGEYVDEGSTYRIWLEEERSLEEKLKVMKERGLAGVAAWKLGIERSSVWDTIIKYTN